MQQEELSRLFSASMSLCEQQHVAQQQQALQSPEQIANSQPITYISQHYTHSYHVAPIRQSQNLAQNAEIDVNASDPEAILIQHNINPASLFPSQFDLFKNGDGNQRLRLIQLWSISPPTGRQGVPD